jgi:hypothetical protein
MIELENYITKNYYELNLPLFMAASHMDRGLGERKIKEIN